MVDVKNIRDVFGADVAGDYTGLPTHECPCGSDLFMVVTKFYDQGIAMYYTTGMCISCRSLVTVPTPVDT